LRSLMFGALFELCDFRIQVWLANPQHTTGGEFVINCAGLYPDSHIIPNRGDSYKILGCCMSRGSYLL